MKRIPRIEFDTPLVPYAAAVAVCEEASLWLGEPLPRRWPRELVTRANTVYAHNPRFRQLIRGHGTRGRDWLWSFMRHWLTGLMWEHRQHLYARLPAGYCVGRPLPEKPLAPVAKSPPETRRVTGCSLCSPQLLHSRHQHRMRASPASKFSRQAPAKRMS